jgi:hypothetical protein
VSGTWLHPRDWWKAGQGRSFDFAVPRAELIAAIEAVAYDNDDQFDVVVCELKQPAGGRRFRSERRVVPVGELLAVDATNQFLRSKRLTRDIPDIEPSQEWDWAAACSLNGLILVQRSVGSHPPRLGIVPRVEHRQTGDRVDHVHYDRLFRAIKRNLQRAMAES